jgi:hypothetical protein
MADALIVMDEAGTQVRFLPITEILPKGRREPRLTRDGQRWKGASTLSEEFDSMGVAISRLDRVRAEIDREVNSCHRAIGAIRKQLSTLSLVTAGK